MTDRGYSMRVSYTCGAVALLLLMACNSPNAVAAQAVDETGAEFSTASDDELDEAERMYARFADAFWLEMARRDPALDASDLFGEMPPKLSAAQTARLRGMSDAELKASYDLVVSTIEAIATETERREGGEQLASADDDDDDGGENVDEAGADAQVPHEDQTGAAEGQHGDRQAGGEAARAARVGGSSSWPTIGRYAVGQQVLHTSTGKIWNTGTINKIDPEHGYEIRTEYGVDYGFKPASYVVSPVREAFWTDFFVGDWRVEVGSAINIKTDGQDLYRTFSGGLQVPPLRINADGTYSWRGRGERLITGRWTPNPKGPGVILQRAEGGADWLVANHTTPPGDEKDVVQLSAPDQPGYYRATRLR